VTIVFRMHWVLVVFDGKDVDYYDSLGSKSYVPDDIELQIAAIVNPPNKKFTINTMKCELQADSVSCGLYTIAMMIEVFMNGYINNKTKYVAATMRNHIARMLVQKQVSEFPKRSKRGATHLPTQEAPVKSTIVQTYCICNMPQCYDVRSMQCEGCGEWFHPSCIGHPRAAQTGNIELSFKEIDNWCCPLCGQPSAGEASLIKMTKKKV
jgi:rubredoxin